MPFKKGHKQFGHIRKGQKQDKTILKENARKVFEEIQLKAWLKLSEKQLKDALKNPKVREYTINQVIGKPKESVEMSGPEGGPVKLEVNILDSISKVYGRFNKPRNTSNTSS
jgi:hypothetical protein